MGLVPFIRPSIVSKGHIWTCYVLVFVFGGPTKGPYETEKNRFGSSFCLSFFRWLVFGLVVWEFGFEPLAFVEGKWAASPNHETPHQLHRGKLRRRESPMETQAISVGLAAGKWGNAQPPSHP